MLMVKATMILSFLFILYFTTTINGLSIFKKDKNFQNGMEKVNDTLGSVTDQMEFSHENRFKRKIGYRGGWGSKPSGTGWGEAFLSKHKQKLTIGSAVAVGGAAIYTAHKSGNVADEQITLLKLQQDIARRELGYPQISNNNKNGADAVSFATILFTFLIAFLIL